MLEIDLEKIKKYDKPGPRYTSYPTALQFNDNFKAAEYLDQILNTDHENPSDFSLYFHLPYCDTLCYFCGCNMIITHDRNRVKKYISYLKKEIDLVKSCLNSDRKAVQLHWGGGTPTHLNPDEIAELASYTLNSFHFNIDSENSCEIDPRALTKEHLTSLRENGFNRISMGVQDFNEKVQKAVNRVQPEDLTRQVVAWVKELKFHSINLDLIYGLPFQTVETFADTVDKIIDIFPDRIAVFNYAHVPWLKKHMSLIHQEDLPEPDVKLNILKMTVEKLTKAGYVFIGMDHFAKPDDNLAIALKSKKLYRNFQGYSTHAGIDLFAMGISGISQLRKSYAQNYKTEKEYYRLLDKETLPVSKGCYLSEDDFLRKYVIMKLMCDFELSFNSIEEKFSINFREYFKWALNNLIEMQEDELVRIEKNKLEVTNMGRLFVRNIAMNFDKYLMEKNRAAHYSRTV